LVVDPGSGEGWFLSAPPCVVLPGDVLRDELDPGAVLLGDELPEPLVAGLSEELPLLGGVDVLGEVDGDVLELGALLLLEAPLLLPPAVRDERVFASSSPVAVMPWACWKSLMALWVCGPMMPSIGPGL
jgi:hypothetical protein